MAVQLETLHLKTQLLLESEAIFTTELKFIFHRFQKQTITFF